MAYRACLRCGDTDLAPPPDAPERGASFAWVCARCGHVGPPAELASAAALAEFQAARAAVFRAPGSLEPARPRRPSAMTRGLAALVGAAFLAAGLLALLTAARAGGEAWFTVGPSAVVALLFSAPFLALARRR
ncbi:MAG TPA: hypothetical protein VGR28_05045 [Candidatus Thermoplasmatota archaeon]|jgi:hypothetical protein|nr:hypothetical protein [Candidatus Thermoplasmatota archaeon]